jgi:hypothetical protein
VNFRNTIANAPMFGGEQIYYENYTLVFCKKKKALLYSSVVQVSLIFIYAGHFFMIVDSKEQHCKTEGCAGFFLSFFVSFFEREKFWFPICISLVTAIS